MSFGYTTVDGQRVEAHVAAALAAMNKEFEAAFGYRLVVTSGTRTREEQAYLYNGWINRLPGFNLAAPPGRSNHEESGPSGPRAVDLADTGPDWGVSRRGTVRDRWMEQNAHRWEFENEGYNFNPVEAWHKTFRGVIGGLSTGGGTSLPIDEKVLREQQFLNAYRGENLVPDGQYGSASKAAYERYQVFLKNNFGYEGEIDGAWGPMTQAAHERYYATLVAQTFPTFPLPAGYYFGPASGPAESISGLYSYEGALKPWQQRMKDRGWDIGDVDGIYGPKVEAVARAFQEEKQILPVDGLIGPNTWNGAWTAPVTPPANGETPAPPNPEPEIPANPRTPQNPRGLTIRPVPFYPGAFLSLEAPLGDGERGTGFEDQREVPYVIDQFHLHRTGTDGDDTDWFSYRNSRSSCPHVLVMTDGRAKEFIRPKMKPALTGPKWNYRGWGIEIQGAGDGNPVQFETVADSMAWLASYEGKELDGVPVKYNLRQESATIASPGRTNTHRDMLPGTECPGDWWQSAIPALLVRAREILATKYAPTAPPVEPEEPEYVIPPELAQILADLNTALTTASDKIGDLVGE